MRVALLAVAVLLCADKVFGASQVVYYTTSIVDSKVTFDIKIYVGDEIVTAAVVADPTTGLESTGTSANACSFTTEDGSLVEDVSAGNAVRLLSVVIDYSTSSSPVFTDTASTDLGCDFQTIDATAGKFTFYLRGLASTTETNAADREYILTSTGSEVPNKREDGSTTFAGPPSTTLNVVTPTLYTLVMSVVDASNDKQTTMSLGDSAKLKFTMTADPYIVLMDLGGARLTNCIVDKVSTFDSSAITIIGSDGCFKEVDIFTNMVTTQGFNRHAASSTSSPTIKRFVAYSPTFEMSAFTTSTSVAPNALYFRCDVEPCLDDSDTSTAGQCGANHCDAGRRKRDTGQRSDTTVMASVNITTHSNSKESCKNCTDTTTFQASLCGLGTLVAIMFGLMTVSFTSARSAAIVRLQRRKKAELDHSYVSRIGSSMHSKATTGSDVIIRGSNIPRTTHA